MVKKSLVGLTVLSLVMILTMLMATSVAALPANSSGNNTPPGLVAGMGLTPDQTEKTSQLIKKFMGQIQESNTKLTNLLLSGPSNDPKTDEKISFAQRDFGLKRERFQLDLTDLIGAEKSQQITAKIDLVIPKALISGGELLLGSHSGHPNGNENPPTNTNNSLKETPLGSTPVDPGTSQTPNLDLQITGNSSTSGTSGGDHSHGGGDQKTGGMEQMMAGMMGGMNNMSSASNTANSSTPNTSNMANMPNTNGASNSPSPTNMSNMSNMQPMAGTGFDTVNRQILVHLQSINTMLIQLLATSSNQGATQGQLQPIYQLLAQQSAFIQMLYSNVNAAAGAINTSSPSTGAAGSSNMGGMNM